MTYKKYKWRGKGKGDFLISQHIVTDTPHKCIIVLWVCGSKIASLSSSLYIAFSSFQPSPSFGYRSHAFPPLILHICSAYHNPSLPFLIATINEVSTYAWKLIFWLPKNTQKSCVLCWVLLGRFWSTMNEHSHLSCHLYFLPCYNVSVTIWHLIFKITMLLHMWNQFLIATKSQRHKKIVLCWPLLAIFWCKCIFIHL